MILASKSSCFWQAAEPDNLRFRHVRNFTRFSAAIRNQAKTVTRHGKGTKKSAKNQIYFNFFECKHLKQQDKCVKFNKLTPFGMGIILLTPVKRLYLSCLFR